MLSSEVIVAVGNFSSEQIGIQESKQGCFEQILGFTKINPILIASTLWLQLHLPVFPFQACQSI